MDDAENTMKKFNLNTLCLSFSLLTVALLSSNGARAETEPSWYFGASAGPTKSSIDDARILQSLSNVGLDANIIDHNRDNGYKVFGGYHFNRFLALEGSYFDLGRFNFAASTTPPGTLNGEIRLRGFGLDAVLNAPLTEQFSVFAKVGANYAQARDRFSASGAVTVPNSAPRKTEFNPKLGIGMHYALTDALALRGEFERYRINDAVGNRGDVDLLTVGLVYSWGRTQAPVSKTQPILVTQVAVMPLVVVVEPPAPLTQPAPTPIPKAVVPIVPIVPTKVTLSADSLFAFDKSTLSPDGKKELDDFFTKLKTLSYEFMTVTGHTDRLGEHVYNMRLSERRAQAVGAYLMNVLGVPADKLLVRGQNGADPVTQPGDCVGTQVTKQLIACLQPDRRVDLEVTGTR